MPAASELQQQLVALVSKARAIDAYALEESSAEEIRNRTLPVVAELVGEALDIFGRIVKLHDGISDVTSAEFRLPVAGKFERLVEGMMHSASAHRVVDLCFVGGFELRPLYERLIESCRAGAEPGLLVQLVSSTLRKLARAATAIENALADLEGLSTRLGYTSLLDIGLETRRVYAKLRRGLAAGAAAAGGGGARERLTSAATAIATLRGQEIYPELRFSDRVELSRLQHRVFAWMKAADESKREDGLHLFQDIVTFAELLREVSRRPELIEHDRRKIAEMRRWGDGRSAVCRSLWGLDDELDSFIDAGEVGDLDRLNAVLQRLEERLAPSRGAAEGQGVDPETEAAAVSWHDLLDDSPA